ncbi:hypothetical protein E2C01_079933 [Portunus trituberculatus]
MQPM